MKVILPVIPIPTIAQNQPSTEASSPNISKNLNHPLLSAIEQISKNIIAWKMITVTEGLNFPNPIEIPPRAIMNPTILRIGANSYTEQPL